MNDQDRKLVEEWVGGHMERPAKGLYLIKDDQILSLCRKAEQLETDKGELIKVCESMCNQRKLDIKCQDMCKSCYLDKTLVKMGVR